jgi:hypothetical protein
VLRAVGEIEVDPGAPRAQAARHGLGYRRQRSLDVQRRRHLVREPGEHFVGFGAISIHESVGPPLRRVTNRLEPDRHETQRGNRKDPVGRPRRSNKAPRAHRDGHVRTGDEQREHGERNRLVDDEVDIEQAVLEDRDADCDWNKNPRQRS